MAKRSSNFIQHFIVCIVCIDAHNVGWQNEISMRTNIEQSAYFLQNKAETSMQYRFWLVFFSLLYQLCGWTVCIAIITLLFRIHSTLRTITISFTIISKFEFSSRLQILSTKHFVKKKTPGSTRIVCLNKSWSVFGYLYSQVITLQTVAVFI